MKQWKNFGSPARMRADFVFLICCAIFVFSRSFAAIYQWNGSADALWSTAANWNETGSPAGITKGPAETGGTFAHRLNVNNTTGNPIVYEAGLGTTRYGGPGLRGLVVGSGASGAGTFRITSALFDTTGSSGANTSDVISSPSKTLNSSIEVAGGTYLANRLQLGLNNPVSVSLSIASGSASIDVLAFNVQDGSANVNLDGGVLQVKSIVYDTSTPGSSNNVFRFAGGTLRAGASSGNFFPNLAATTALVESGGAIIDTQSFDITIHESLTHGSGSGGLTKQGPGKLTLGSAASYTGPTVIESGTLALGAAASIFSTSEIRIDSGATLDLTAQTSPAWPASTPISVSSGNLAISGTLDLGNVPLNLDFTPVSINGDSNHPALTVSGGSLVLGTQLVINNLNPAPLGDGTYRIISAQPGSISGTPLFNGTIGGQGIAPGRIASLALHGGNLDLVVGSPVATTTTISRVAPTSSSSTYGQPLLLKISVLPPEAVGTVEIRNDGPAGTLLGSGTLSDGEAIFEIPGNALPPGLYPHLVARYLGETPHLPSDSTALVPAQEVSQKALLIANAAALNKYYDSTTAGTLAGSLEGVEPGDSVTPVFTGVFASSAVGNSIPFTSTAYLTGNAASRYILVQPVGLTADIIAANVWTGGSGGLGTNLATGSHYSPVATPTNPYTAIFNGLDPSTTDLTLASAIGGAVGTSGMVLGVAGNQLNPVTITGSSGASARISSVIVSPGAGTVTVQGNLPFILGGPSADTTHSFINDSTNPLVFQNSGNWIPGGSGNQLRSIIFSGSGNITVSSNIVPSVPSRIRISKSGSGSLVLSGNNTYSGGVTIHEGTVTTSSSTALGTGPIVLDGTLNLTSGAVNHTGLSSSLTGTGTVNVALGSGTATTPLNGNFSAFSGRWNLGIGASAGAGKVQMNGADHPAASIHVMENATLYTTSGTHQATLYLHGGDTGESLGQLRIEGSALWAGDIVLANGISGAGDGHIGAASGTGRISGTISSEGGSHALVKEGDGTVILTGNNTYPGPTRVNDGVLLVDSPGSLHASSEVTVASGAVLGGSGDISGSLTIDPGGTLDPGRIAPVTLTVGGPVSLGGAVLFRANRSRFPRSGCLLVQSPLTFGGTLQVSNEGPAFRLGDILQLFIAPSYAGSFNSLLLPPLGYDLMWDTSRLAVDGTIKVASAASQDHALITLAPDTYYQQISGIGGNFCQGEQNALVGYDLLDEMFGADGLNMSFIRLSTAHELAEPGFANFDSNNVATIVGFRSRQPKGHVMLTTWTPPESLKSTNSPYLGTIAKNSSGQYRYADYAAWWTRALQFYQNHGVMPDYVSIQNEPDFTPTPPSSGNIPAYIAGCGLNATEGSTRAGYPQALAAVRSAFATAGFGDMKMIGPDTTAIANDKVKSYLDNIPSGQIDAIAHHLYHDDPGSTGIARLSRLQTQYPYWVIPKFMTELNPHDTYEPWDANQPPWMKLAVTMHNVFTYEMANNYMVWSSIYGLVDRFTGLPNNSNYYALAQFSRFVNADDWRVAATSNDPTVLVTHYRHPGGPGISDQRIMVVINTSSEPKHTLIGTSDSWAAEPLQRSWEAWQTANDGTATKRVTRIAIDQGPWLAGDLRLVLPPYSITTARINAGAATSPHSYLDVWRFNRFGTMSMTVDSSSEADPDTDGESNFLEFATGQDPHAVTRASSSLVQTATGVDFIYIRSKGAVLDGCQFTVEWSDALSPGSWSQANTMEAMVSEDDSTETIRASITGGPPQLFLRLKISLAN